MGGVGASRRSEEAFAGELAAIPLAEELDELIAVSGLDAGRHFPLGPRRSGVLIDFVLVGERRTNTVAAENDDELQIGVAASGRRIGSLRGQKHTSGDEGKKAGEDGPQGEAKVHHQISIEECSGRVQ